VQTLAELFDYVSAAWDTGGNAYCGTRTWYGCGLHDVFERLASREGLSAAEGEALAERMRAAMPACRACDCEPAKRAAE